MQALPLQKIVVTPDRRSPRRAAYRRFVDYIKSSRVDTDYPVSLYEARRAAFIRQINHQVTAPTN